MLAAHHHSHTQASPLAAQPPLDSGPAKSRVRKSAAAAMMPSEFVTKAGGGDFAHLIEAIALRRDKEAFAGLFRYFAPRIKTMLVRLGTAPARAEELAQETLLAVWHKAHLFDPEGASGSGWIYRIARNLHIDSVRRDQRGAAAAFDPVDEPEAMPQPDGILAAQQMQSRIRAAVEQLSEDQVSVVTLSFFEDRPHAEIAAQLQLPLGTVKSRLRLALKRLRTLLDESS